MSHSEISNLLHNNFHNLNKLCIIAKVTENLNNLLPSLNQPPPLAAVDDSPNAFGSSLDDVDDSSVVESGALGSSVVESGALASSVVESDALGSSVVESGALGPSVVVSDALGSSVVESDALAPSVVEADVVCESSLGETVVDESADSVVWLESVEPSGAPEVVVVSPDEGHVHKFV